MDVRSIALQYVAPRSREGVMVGGNVSSINGVDEGLAPLPNRKGPYGVGPQGPVAAATANAPTPVGHTRVPSSGEAYIGRWSNDPSMSLSGIATWAGQGAGEEREAVRQRAALDSFVASLPHKQNGRSAPTQAQRGHIGPVRAEVTSGPRRAPPPPPPQAASHTLPTAIPLNQQYTRHDGHWGVVMQHRWDPNPSAAHHAPPTPERGSGNPPRLDDPLEVLKAQMTRMQQSSAKGWGGGRSELSANVSVADPSPAVVGLSGPENPFPASMQREVPLAAPTSLGGPAPLGSPTHIDGGRFGQLGRLRNAVDVLNAVKVGGATSEDNAASGSHGSTNLSQMPRKGPPPTSTAQALLSAQTAKDLQGVMAILIDKLNLVEHEMTRHQTAHISGRAALIRKVDGMKERADDTEFRVSEAEASADAKLADLKTRVESRLATCAQLRENLIVKLKTAISAEIRSANLGAAKGGDDGGAPSQAAHANHFRQGIEELRELMLQYQTHADARMTTLQFNLQHQLSELQNQLKGASYLVYRRGGIGSDFAALSVMKEALGGGGGGAGVSLMASPEGAGRGASNESPKPVSTAPSGDGEAQSIRFDNRTPANGSFVSDAAASSSGRGDKGALMRIDAAPAVIGPSSAAEAGGLTLRSPLGDGGIKWLMPHVGSNATSMSALAGGVGASLEACKGRFMEAVGHIQSELSQLRIERTQFEAHFLGRIAQLSTAGAGQVPHDEEGMTINTRGLVSVLGRGGGAPTKGQMGSTSSSAARPTTTRAAASNY